MTPSTFENQQQEHGMDLVKSSLVACVTSLFVLAAQNSLAQVKPHAGMMRYPDVSRSHIVFVYANDLWLAPREGGMASPLASPPGPEVLPRFSPDGQTIAFVGNYDGNRDLYTIAVEGGVPLRITHHPSSETLCDWTPAVNGSSAQLLFFTNGQAGLQRQQQLFTVGLSGGLPAKLPVPYGAMGAISPDGAWLAYTPHTADNRTWKRYRGGMATDIWLFNLQDHTARKITDWEGTDTQPMWNGGKLFYLTDAGDEHRLNIWSYDFKSGERRQVTRFKDFDCKWPSIGPGPDNRGEIVLQNGSKLYLLDLESNASKEVSVTIPGDRPTIRTRTVDATKFIQSWTISPTGKRAAVQARGDIWTAPAEEGAPRNLTRTDTAHERDPAWSPDGRWIAYLSDVSGEYELYITQSDGKGETKRLTTDGQHHRFLPRWSPDSKRILFVDKSGVMLLHTIGDAEAGTAGETKEVDRDPWVGGIPTISWSHDSRWMAYEKAREDVPFTAIWIYSVESGETKQATSGTFNDSTPGFDRKGDYLFYQSNRALNAQYSDIPVDTTFIYTNSEVLLAAPLRTDIDYVWTPKSDEEKWDDKKKEDEATTQPEGTATKPDGAATKPEDEDNDDDDEDAAPAKPDDGVSGTWEGKAQTPDGEVAFTLTLSLKADNSVTGNLSSPMFSGPVSGTYSPADKTLTLTATLTGGLVVEINVKIDGDKMTGTGTADGQASPMEATRISKGDAGETEDDKKKEDDKPREKVDIEFDGFERRAIPLPVANGNFGVMGVNDSSALIYARVSAPGNAPVAGIYLFDLKDDKKEEKSVATGASAFEISGDGKKMLIVRGNSASIQNAAAGGTGKNVITDGMKTQVDPRDEWNQIFNESWRQFRDFFYVGNMHGMDWPAIRNQYAAMLPDATTREDVAYIISEMISELNVGHAYYNAGEATEEQPTVPVGMLGCDFALENGAYRITKIHEGGVWDSDARGPLSQPGVKVKEGDYLLEVNGQLLDPARDPWTPFVGAAGQVVALTVSEKATKDDTAREVLVKPIGSEADLRYRSWIESKRRYVDEKSDGQIGYIYVPDTGVNGQNNLHRQFYGQIGRKALIIDERWNGGGQIPTRFIELLNRPRTNYWARRDGKDWPWPPDSHQGPKCMLINGLAGSGGDMFPWLFKQAGLGPLIGMRTWGGLVGISGNPDLIDGASVSVPTFGFYETDGTWGVEGHGTAPDIEVIDDPALMVDGGDPQLDRAIEEMLKAMGDHPYAPAKRPADPDRKGMGIRPEDK